MSDHPWQDLAAPYALDVLEDFERVGFEAHLRECDACRTEVNELREVAGLLAHAAPPVAPPAGLRDRILAEARRTPQSTETPVLPLRPKEAPAAAAPRSGSVGRWLPWLAAAASLVVALGTGLELRRERGARAALEQRVVATEAAVSARDSLLATVLGPQVETTTLAATGAPPSVRLYLNRERGVVVLAANDLPPAPAGRTYQLWGIAQGGAPVSLGTFNSGAGGRATATLPIPAGLDPAISAVTEEPAGGSPQPTTTPFLVGSWTSSS